jgi:hypothetical protein
MPVGSRGRRDGDVTVSWASLRASSVRAALPHLCSRGEQRHSPRHWTGAQIAAAAPKPSGKRYPYPDSLPSEVTFAWRTLDGRNRSQAADQQPQSEERKLHGWRLVLFIGLSPSRFFACRHHRSFGRDVNLAMCMSPI